MSCGPPHNVVHWGYPFETPRYTKIILWSRGCVKPGHHAISLVLVGAMYREFFGAITELQKKRNCNTIFVMRPIPTSLKGPVVMFPPPLHCTKFLLYMISDSSMFVNIAILLILVSIPIYDPNSCCWFYSRETFNDGNHLPIFLILSSSNPTSFIAHAPPDQF